jgi:hypothetical protein
MDPYSQVSSLKDDAISQPILDTDENGKKVINWLLQIESMSTLIMRRIIKIKN